MPIWNRTATRLITVRSWTALGLIALLVSASFAVTLWAVAGHRERLAVLDYAATQRMLGQRIPLLANALARAADEDQRRNYRARLAHAVEAMDEAHQILNLTKPVPLPDGARSILRDIYQTTHAFDARIGRFIDDARAVLEAGGDIRPDNPALGQLSIMGVGVVREGSQLVYTLLRSEAQTALARYLGISTALWLLTLGVMALELPLIFRPMAGRTAQSLRELDAARRKAEREAADAEAERDDRITFMRVVNHEMRTPLNAVLGMTALLRMTGLPSKQDEYARQIQEAAQHLLGLINHSLDFREVESDLVRVKPAPVSLRHELERILELFRPLAEKKGLEMDCRADDDLATRYLADGMRIRQVLSCLVSNAVKFTEQGSVTLRACIAGPADASTDFVRFEVRDTGIGVPPELREHIFEPWKQVEDILARKYGGLGLGLAIARRLVYLMKGEIGVESADGLGSVFWFVLPLERAEESESSAPGKAEEPSFGARGG